MGRPPVIPVEKKTRIVLSILTTKVANSVPGHDDLRGGAEGLVDEQLDPAPDQDLGSPSERL